MIRQMRMVSVRSLPAAQIAVVSAVVVLAPSVIPRTAPVIDSAAQLTAAALPVDPDLPDLASLAPEFTDTALLVSPAASSVGDGIESLYLTLEQGVGYGFSLLSYLVGWIPFIGLLAPQINFFYDLGESIVQTTLFNTVDVLDGTTDFSQALSNISNDTNAAFNTFIDTETSWFQHFLPPPPPFAASPTDLSDAVPGPDPVALPEPGALADLTPEPGDALLSLVS